MTFPIYRWEKLKKQRRLEHTSQGWEWRLCFLELLCRDVGCQCKNRTAAGWTPTSPFLGPPWTLPEEETKCLTSLLCKALLPRLEK